MIVERKQEERRVPQPFHTLTFIAHFSYSPQSFISVYSHVNLIFNTYHLLSLGLVLQLNSTKSYIKLTLTTQFSLKHLLNLNPNLVNIRKKNTKIKRLSLIIVFFISKLHSISKEKESLIYISHSKNTFTPALLQQL